MDDFDVVYPDYWEAALALARGFVRYGIDPGPLDEWLPFEVAAFEVEGLVPQGTAPTEFEVPESQEEFAAMKQAKLEGVTS